MSSQRKAIRIEPFKHPVAMDPGYADKTWRVLEDAIKEIHRQNASGLSFEVLYRNAYNMVLHKHGEKLYSGLTRTLTSHLKHVAEQVEGVQGVLFLLQLKNKWDVHNKSTQMIRDILMYMDRTFVQQQQRTPVFTLGLDLWRDHVLKQKVISERVRTILLDLIQKERSKEVVDKSLLRSTTQMMVDLGLPVYMSEFETPFLTASSEFYKREASEFLSSANCPQYLIKAEQRLQEEEDRVQSYLSANTLPKITHVVETELISNQMRALVEMENSGLLSMLRSDAFEDLSRLYNLLKRVPEGLNLIRGMMADHIKEAGKQLVMDPELNKDPVEYIQQLLTMREKYETIVVKAFSDDKSFKNALNHSFEHFVNLNSRSPEYTSLFIDSWLRKGLRTVSDADMELNLDKVMALFRYLTEKDLFEKYYKHHLAKRLLAGKGLNDDAERSLLVKLKTECGNQFTSKMEGMFTDIRMSRDMMQEFRTHCTNENTILPIEVQVQVLTTGSWPTQPPSKCNLPRELEECCSAFSAWYDKKQTGRKLSWQSNMGTVDVRAEFGNKKHELNVSTHQLCILLLFNDSHRLCYKDVASATEIPSGELKRALQSLSLVKGKNILRKEPQSKEVLDTDIFSFNDKFTSKFYKVKISTVAATREGENEKADTRYKVEEDRKPQIDAAIVRIMKSRKVQEHNQIIAEVTTQLSSRFAANPSMIKKRMEYLIEREFLIRDPDDRRKYRYVA